MMILVAKNPAKEGVAKIAARFAPFLSINPPISKILDPPLVYMNYLTVNIKLRLPQLQVTEILMIYQLQSTVFSKNYSQLLYARSQTPFYDSIIYYKLGSTEISKMKFVMIVRSCIIFLEIYRIPFDVALDYGDHVVQNGRNRARP